MQTPPKNYAESNDAELPQLPVNAVESVDHPTPDTLPAACTLPDINEKHAAQDAQTHGVPSERVRRDATFGRSL